MTRAVRRRLDVLFAQASDVAEPVQRVPPSMVPVYRVGADLGLWDLLVLEQDPEVEGRVYSRLIWNDRCQGPVVAVENGPVVFQAAVGAFFSVHSDGRFHRPWAARATKVTDDIGRFDDESR